MDHLEMLSVPQRFLSNVLPKVETLRCILYANKRREIFPASSSDTLLQSKGSFKYQLTGGGGGAKAVWNFSKNSSDLVAGPFPKEGMGKGKA